MAFLEDLGRSNALGGVNRVFEKAIDMRQMENQEANQALGRAIDLEQLGMAKAASEREATKFKWQEKEAKTKQAIDEMPVPLTALFGVGWEKDPAKKMQFDKMKEKGLVEEVVPGVVMTTNRNAQVLKEYGKQDLEWTKQVNEQNMISINNQITQVGAALAGDKEASKSLGINKPEELEQKKVELEKKLAGYVAAHKRIDIEHQNKVELEKIKGTEAAKIRSKSAQDIASLKADVAREIAEIRAAAKAKAGTSDDSKEEKRKVKLLDTSRREVERAYGYSQFLPTAQDPQLIEKVGKSKALVEDIIEHYKDYGFKKEPTPGQAAIRAKDEIEALYKKKNNPPKVEDTKTKTIRELLFGPGKK